MSRQLSMNIEDGELIDVLEDALSGCSHSHIIAKAIVNNLAKTPVGLSHLIKALVGLDVSTKYNVGDKVYAKRQNLPTWRWDDTRMKELLFQDCLLCEIESIDLYSADPYGIVYTIYREGNENSEVDRYNCKDEALLPCDVGDIELI